MGIAGLWAWWKSPHGIEQHSFTMITINADQHPLMKQFHKTDDEKRMAVILPEKVYDDWLFSDLTHRVDFLQAYPADALRAKAVVESSSND